jgi:hypothetical protein
MKANTGRRLSRRGRACVPWKPSDVWTCVSAVLYAVLIRAPTLTELFDANRRAWRRWTSLRLCGQSAYLSTTTTETLADSPSGSDWSMGSC